MSISSEAYGELQKMLSNGIKNNVKIEDISKEIYNKLKKRNPDLSVEIVTGVVDNLINNFPDAEVFKSLKI